MSEVAHCRICRRPGVATCTRCAAPLCERHRHGQGARCRLCEQEFAAARPVRKASAIAMAAGGAILGSATGLVVGLVAHVLGLSDHAQAVMTVIGALGGAGALGASSYHAVIAGSRRRFLTGTTAPRQAAALPPARIHD